MQPADKENGRFCLKIEIAVLHYPSTIIMLQRLQDHDVQYMPGSVVVHTLQGLMLSESLPCIFLIICTYVDKLWINVGQKQYKTFNTKRALKF